MESVQDEEEVYRMHYLRVVFSHQKATPQISEETQILLTQFLPSSKTQ